jgi:MinD superfamily P-loop ATPase
MFYIAEKDLNKCKQCGWCEEIVAYSSRHIGYEEECIGCEACYIACPNEAIIIKEREEEILILKLMEKNSQSQKG